MSEPDTTAVDIHRIDGPVEVSSIEGEAWRVDEGELSAVGLEVGETLKVGDTIALGSGARLVAGPLSLEGGRHGKAHALVDQEAFASSPSRADVPRLLSELEQIEEQLLDRVGVDPLSMQAPPSSPWERAMAADFALSNLCPDEARELAPTVGRRIGAVLLYLQGDSACVAVSELSVAKMRDLVRALGRPINPHMVDVDTLQLLMDGVYGPQGGQN